MLTPDDAGTILSDLGALKTQSVEESSSSDVLIPMVVISELKCHGGCRHYIKHFRSHNFRSTHGPPPIEGHPMQSVPHVPTGGSGRLGKDQSHTMSRDFGLC